MQMSDIGTKDVREDELNPRLRYAMIRLENLQNICRTRLVVYRRV